MKRFQVGDCSLIGEGSRFLASEFQVGDYAKIHNHSLVLGPSSCKIGHNCWIGERTVLNCHAPLKIGDNVQIGMENHIWTHVIGELIEGSTLQGARSVTLENDVWLCGNGTVICPGITLARGTVVLPNSVVTHSTMPFHCYGGNPARDITRKVRPWKPVSLHAKWEMMMGFVREFLAERDENPIIRTDPRHYTVRLIDGSRETLFDVRKKTYRKTLSPLERDFMFFLVGSKARFIPEGA